VSREDRIELRDDCDEIDLKPADAVPTRTLRAGVSEVATSEASRPCADPPRRPELERLAYKIHLERIQRNRLFNEELFGEPAWDILLCLYALPPRGEMLTVMSLSLAANVPSTTGIRWQRTLEEKGLIERRPHGLDKRLQLIGLSARGRLLMDQYLSGLLQCKGQGTLKDRARN